MNVSLTPELEQFIQSQIASGKYATPAEVIVDALKMFAAAKQYKLKHLKNLAGLLVVCKMILW
ncbi:MAG: type II toxin-antitoxin system ParD family antitoxin [Goleter apudmare HA4340-LM2]|jgi:putative addiction module CopG family antidote|nr:type II toxin-antitoxin system ParD family antitoxin [Goleter apudmare HA4340-LM2]